MNWRWISITALLGALVLGYRALTGRDTLDVASVEIPPQPGYYLKDAVITQTGEDGSPSLRLIADRIEETDDHSGIELYDVHVDYLNAPQKHWLLTAQQGFVPANSRTIEFKGDVELRPADGTADTVLRTESLQVDTARNIAHAARSPVQISMGRNTLVVKSFEADLNTEKVTLESARGRFFPQ